MSPLLMGSVTRIADLPEWPFPFEKVDREAWRSGDYVVAEVLPREFLTDQFELPSAAHARRSPEIFWWAPWHGEQPPSRPPDRLKTWERTA